MTPLEAAYEEFNRCQEALNRNQNPIPGRRDRYGRFWPDDDQKAECCNIHPSSAYPDSFINHCCTAKHIATKFGVEQKELRRLINAGKPNPYSPIPSAAANVSSDDPQASVWRSLGFDDADSEEWKKSIYYVSE